MKNDIKRHNSDNLGGVNSYIFIPSDHVVFIPPVIEGSVRMAIDIKPGTRWLRGYGTENTMQYLEEPQDSDNGAFFIKKFTCLVPKHRSTLVDNFDQAKNRRYVLIITDNNGKQTLVGSKSEPLSFKSVTNTKSAVAERNEVSIEFTGEGVSKSPIFSGLCPLLKY